MNDLLKSVFNTLSESNVKNNSTSKKELFKKELFQGLSENEEKRTRSKMRKIALSFCELIIATKSEKDIADFKTFFNKVYAVEFNASAFDSLQKDSKKAIVTKAFAIITEIEKEKSENNNANPKKKVNKK
jgi:hypothetical protein